MLSLPLLSPQEAADDGRVFDRFFLLFHRAQRLPFHIAHGFQPPLNFCLEAMFLSLPDQLSPKRRITTHEVDTLAALLQRLTLKILSSSLAPAGERDLKLGLQVCSSPSFGMFALTNHWMNAISMAVALQLDPTRHLSDMARAHARTRARTRTHTRTHTHTNAHTHTRTYARISGLTSAR
eukprot:5940322-Pleurochrysis_carterae.AAC.1